MTKTELEDDFDRCFDKNTSPTGGGYEADWTDRNGLWNDFKPAVESFAKQEAIEFKKWCEKNKEMCSYYKGQSNEQEDLWDLYSKINTVR